MSIKSLIDQGNAFKKSAFLQKAGGKPAQIGEIRTHGGVKMQKTASGWVPVTGDKKPPKPEKKEGPRSRKPQEQTQSTQSSEQQTQPVSKHDVAQLTQMKRVFESDPTKAYEIYQSLSPEAQNEVPQQIVNKLVEHSHKPEVDTTQLQKFDIFGDMMSDYGTGFNQTMSDAWFESSKNLLPDNIDEEVIRSIGDYADDRYQDMNAYLRNSDSFDDKRFYTKDAVKKDVDNISNLIKSSKGLNQDIVTYRGINLTNPVVADFFNSLQEGDVYSDKAFQSTSLNKQVSEKSFRVHKDSERGLTLKVLIPKGTKVLPMNSVKDRTPNIIDRENEVLLDRDTKFQVVSRENGIMTVMIV